MKNLLILIPLIVVVLSIDFTRKKEVTKYADQKSNVNNIHIYKKNPLKESIVVIYYFEKMTFELYTDFQNNNQSLYEFIRQIKNKELANMDTLNQVVKKYSFNDKRKDFYSINNNKLYKLLHKTKEKNEILKYICIVNNSISYKYSELIKDETQEYDKYSFSIIEDKSIKNLLFIDQYIIDNFNKGGCCSLANVLCPIKTITKTDTILVNYKNEEV